MQHDEVHDVHMVSKTPSPETTNAEEEPCLAAVFAVAAAAVNAVVAVPLL